MGYQAIMVGATGAVGGALFRELVASPAAAAGVRHVSLLSALGAKLESWVRYFRVKGAAEAAVTQAGLPRTSLFRPSLLVTKTIRYGLLDRFAQAVFPVIARVLPANCHEIRVEDLGRAFCLNAERPARASVEILHYPEIAALL